MRLMARLGINIDHVATLRQARGGGEPDPVAAAALVELAGADGIVVHLREDRRHIQDRDLRLLRETVRTHLNLEMAAVDEILKIALQIKPDVATFVPERRDELTTEGGLNAAALKDRLAQPVRLLRDAGIRVSFFIEAETDQVRAAHKLSADAIEIHTGVYANAREPRQRETEIERIVSAARLASKLGLMVAAGHGLDYWNVPPLRKIEEITEYNIGHSIMSRAILVGLDRAVREMKALVA